MKLSISEILKKASDLQSKNEKIEWLRKNDMPVLRSILRHALDPNIQFNLPEGDPPYKPNPYPDQQGVLYSEARKLYLFVKGQRDDLSNFKRETLFVQFIENIDPEDAKLMLAVKDKKLPYKSLTPKLIQEAFPDLF